MLNDCVINELLQWFIAGKTGEAGLSPHQREGVVMWNTREWSTLSTEYDKLTTSSGDGGWVKFRDLIRQKTELQVPKGKYTWMVCCPIHVKVHWVWAVVLLEERVIIIVDPLKSHTGSKAHRQIIPPPSPRDTLPSLLPYLWAGSV